MKLVFIIAVFCVVPCAFQGVWDDYDTWYDDLNNLNGDVADNLDDQLEDDNVPEAVPNNEDKEVEAADEDDYNNERDYKDYEIEDNRDGVKTNFDKDQEPNQNLDLEGNDQNVESAVEDFDAFQQIINNDQFSDVLDKILEVDEQSQMDLNVLLPDGVSSLESNNDEDIPRIQLGTNNFNKLLDDMDADGQVEENLVQETDVIEKDENEEETGDEEVQSNDGDDNDDVESLLVAIKEDNLDGLKDGEEINNIEKDEDEKEEEPQNVIDAEKSKNDVVENMKSLIEETKNILEETNIAFDENENEQQNINLSVIENDLADIKKIVDETREILEETNVEFDENLNQEPIQNEQALGVDEQVESDDDEENIDENSVEKAYEDLNDDLDKLLETFNKIANDDDETDNVAQSGPFDEEVVNDGIEPDSVKTNNEDKKADFDYDGEARILKMRNDYYDSLANNDLSDLFKEFDDTDNVDEEADSPTNDEKEIAAPIAYVNDALEASNNDQQNTVAVNATGIEESEDVVLENEPLYAENKTENPLPFVPTKLVEDLTSSELDELNEQFTLLHKSEINLERDVAPVHITLSADEPVTITSPDYPNAYPTDSAVVDWILEGLGTGVELNVTDLEINSAQGHFLMIKPGQSDDSGEQGIVFAYRLTRERRYRFRDVNRVFIRFNPLGGMAFSRGFSLSAKMIEPPTPEEDEDLPEPEYLIPAPRETTTLYLAGVNSTAFLEIRDEFRRLLADMATMYINANDIDPGMNSTDAVTQITRSYVCNVNWPEFESCVEVSFGVPLVYEDANAGHRLRQSELVDMWNTYSVIDPFAARLGRMGISDYSVPKDSYVLTLWVVLGVGVVIAAAMLAFALWRYSCIENYTRMQEFSDTDSIHDKKRALDMYPTPHQTLPPLYSENDYKWADQTFDDSTRVDMGGFTNNTFTRDDLSESEEDVVVPRDRNSFKARDFSAV